LKRPQVNVPPVSRASRIRVVSGGKPGVPVLALLLALLAILSCGRTQTQSTLDRIKATHLLRIGTDATYPPFESVDPGTGAVVGFDVDLVQALAAKLGARAEFTVVPFDGIIPGLRSGKYDLVVSAMTITPERAREVKFTEPYTVAGQTVAVRADEANIHGTADLEGHKIGCQLGTTGELEARKIAKAQVVSFDAIGSAFRDLENGNLDAVIADVPTARIFVRDHPTIKLAGEPLTREEFGMAARPQDGDLVEALNRELEALRGNGEMARIESKWGISGKP
jgi:polar amino acid transport system substrate-binding protein